MSEEKPTTIWCQRSTHRWFIELADRRPHDAFLKRLLTLWDSMTPNDRERYLTERKPDDQRTDD